LAAKVGLPSLIYIDNLKLDSYHNLHRLFKILLAATSGGLAIEPY
jgi:hypothetical protein